MTVLLSAVLVLLAYVVVLLTHNRTEIPQLAPGTPVKFRTIHSGTETFVIESLTHDAGSTTVVLAPAGEASP